MSRPILILRPQPGAGATAVRAAALGLEPALAPLFTIRPITWEAPDPSVFDAVLLTSANAARHGGDQFLLLPCYAVGPSTAAAAKQAGYEQVIIGPSDGAAAAAAMAGDGIRRALHLVGRDHVGIAAEGVSIDRRIVYAAEAVQALPEAAQQALARNALVLLHSPRAASLFAALVEERGQIAVAAISAAAAKAAGPGWAAMAIAAEPRDEALLELAVQLCQTEGDAQGQVMGE